MSYLDLLGADIERFELDLPQTQRTLLAMYCDELSRWNTKINLTALSGEALVRRLIVEPLWVAQQLTMSGVLVDIGSGNGSPAIPFQIASGFRACHLVEARARRAAFLRHLATTLKLPNVTVHRAQFEEAVNTLEKPDWISLQAVALTPGLVDSIRVVAHRTTRVVWITTSNRSSLRSAMTLNVPLSQTQVFVYQLDLP